MSKFIAAFIALILLGVAYWFVTDYNKEGSAQRVAEYSGPQDVVMISEQWRSTDDPKFTREFVINGTIVDSYQGDASAGEIGSWITIDPANEANFPVSPSSVAGMKVLKIVFPKAGTMYFSINKRTDTELQMTNLSGRGNMLSFTRVN